MTSWQVVVFPPLKIVFFITKLPPLDLTATIDDSFFFKVNTKYTQMFGVPLWLGNCFFCSWFPSRNFIIVKLNTVLKCCNHQFQHSNSESVYFFVLMIWCVIFPTILQHRSIFVSLFGIAKHICLAYILLLILRTKCWFKIVCYSSPNFKTQRKNSKRKSTVGTNWPETPYT